MAQRYKQTPNVGNATHFTRAPMADVEFSKMTATPKHYTSFNAGDIVPLYYAEVLPHDTFDISCDFVTRLLSPLNQPTMGDLQFDIFAFFVPNRIVNESWKNVQGENTSGSWTAPEVSLAPLYTGDTDVQIPVGSVADYYGFPTQAPIKAEYLQQMNDLKFRGYVEIFNEYFRDQNYQPPIPYSKLNVYNGFLCTQGSFINFDGTEDYITREYNVMSSADGSYPNGAITKALYGPGGAADRDIAVLPVRLSAFSALNKPLKANKLHDPFTSVLPSPQKGSEVYFGIGERAPITFNTTPDTEFTTYDYNLAFKFTDDLAPGANTLSARSGSAAAGAAANTGAIFAGAYPHDGLPSNRVIGSNLTGFADLSSATGVSVNDLRLAVATQQVYEILARGGSRYSSVIASFFGLETANPFMDIPLELGHIRRDLDMFQVAQTSSSTDSETAQGNLSAYSYTNKGGSLFTRTFIEHGYVHILGVVRQRNVYSTYLAPDNFRLNTLDFYLPPLANIGEQPVHTRTLNPFVTAPNIANPTIGYQEAWWEYRYEPDRVSGEMRTGVNGSLANWHYGDGYDPNFVTATEAFMRSNAQSVVDRALASTSVNNDQFIGVFAFNVTKQRPMPVYSIPGLDTI